MPAQTNSKRYLFQADATGVAIQFPNPFNDVVPIQAAATLPSIGGVGSSRIGSFRLGNILSFESAFTEVRGAQNQDGVFETVALSVVEEFNLLNVVKCERILGKLTGTHPSEQENAIVPAGSIFEGLSIGEKYFERLEVAPKFFNDPDHATWTGLQRALENERDRRFLSAITLPDQNGRRVPLPRPGPETDLLGFSIAFEETLSDDEPVRPLVFRVPDFGTVHLGELFCEPSSRRLIMLRAELEGPLQAQVVVGDPIVDGRPYPPG